MINIKIRIKNEHRKIYMCIYTCENICEVDLIIIHIDVFVKMHVLK